MRKFTVIKFAASAIAMAALTACGGGGGGTPESSAPAVVSSPAPAPEVKSAAAPLGPQTIKLISISMTANDVLVQTAPTGTAVSRAFINTIDRATGMFISSAFAQSAGINSGVNIGFTNKLVNGKLVSLQPKFKDSNGKDLACSDSIAEVVVERGWIANTNLGHMLTKMKVPTAVDEKCNVTSWADGTFVVSAAGTVTDVSVTGDTVVSVIEAGDEGFNISSNNVLIYASGMVRELSVADDGNAVLSDLSMTTLPLKTDLGRLAYDGKNLLAVPNDSNFQGTIAIEKGKQGFTMLPFADGANGYIGFGPDNQFMFRSRGTVGKLMEVNITTGVYSPVALPSMPDQAVKPAYDPSQSNGYESPVAALSQSRDGFGGRSGDWAISSNCLLFNMRTFDWVVPKLIGAPADSIFMGSYARLSKGKATCQGGSSSQRFVQYDIATKKLVSFDLIKMGFFPKGIQQEDIYAYGDTLMVKIVDSMTGDLRYIELNFATATATDRGLIQSGNRQVLKLVPIGN